MSIPELAPSGGDADPISGLAVAPGSHLAIVTGEFGSNRIGAFQLPDHSGSGTPGIDDYAVATLPNTPDSQPWNQGLDPHTVTAYASPNDGKAYALMANSPPPKWLAAHLCRH